MPEESPPMSFDAGPPPTVRLSGEVDFRNKGLLHQLLRRAETHPGNICVELSGVNYIDSSGYAELMEEAVRLSSMGRRLSLLSPPRLIVHTLNVSGLARSFDIVQPSAAPSPPQAPPKAARGWQHASFSVPCQVSLLGYARERVMTIARSLAFSEDELGEVELAAGEALSNAFRHGCNSPDDQISVDCDADGTTFNLRVTDPGPGFRPDDIEPPVLENLQEGGMGLHFMRLMMDEVGYEFDDRGTTLKMSKKPKETRVA